jgi:hypothetical protein
MQAAARCLCQTLLFLPKGSELDDKALQNLRKRPSFLAQLFPRVCPEPVLANRSFTALTRKPVPKKGALHTPRGRDRCGSEALYASSVGPSAATPPAWRRMAPDDKTPLLSQRFQFPVLAPSLSWYNDRVES